MTATGASAIQESAFQPSAIGSWFRRLIPERLAPELPEAVAVTRHPKLCPSQSPGLRFPFEFKPLALGRVGTASRHRLHQAAAGRPKVGAWLRRALRSGVHDESCPYLGSPCGEQLTEAVSPTLGPVLPSPSPGSSPSLITQHYPRPRRPWMHRCRRPWRSPACRRPCRPAYRRRR